MITARPARSWLTSDARNSQVTTSIEFLKGLKSEGFDFFTGVPDSTFKTLLAEIEADGDTDYVPAVSEDVAIGLAVGAELAGRKPMVLMQNSGLGVSINAFASLAMMYRVPMLVMIGWRGYEGKDAPEHILIGQCMLRLLEDLGLPYFVLEEGKESSGLVEARSSMEMTEIPTAIIVRPGLFK